MRLLLYISALLLLGVCVVGQDYYDYNEYDDYDYNYDYDTTEAPTPRPTPRPRPRPTPRPRATAPPRQTPRITPRPPARQTPRPPVRQTPRPIPRPTPRRTPKPTTRPTTRRTTPRPTTRPTTPRPTTRPTPRTTPKPTTTFKPVPPRWTPAPVTPKPAPPRPTRPPMVTSAPDPVSHAPGHCLTAVDLQERCPRGWMTTAADLERQILLMDSDNAQRTADFQDLEHQIEDFENMIQDLQQQVESFRDRMSFPSMVVARDQAGAADPAALDTSGKSYPDCQAAYKSGIAKTGVYLIRPRDAPYDIRGYCDNGWTVIQRRFEGVVNFYRPWAQYLAGFGNYSTEFWLGLESIYHLTQQEEYTLRIDMQGISDKWYFIVYPSFSVGGENTYYELSVGNMTVGSIDDALTDGNGFGFSTMDRDNDGWFQKNCARHYFGAWWSSNCGSDLNRRLCKTSGPGCMEWAGIQMKKSLIRIKPSSAIQPDDLLPGA